MLSTKSSYTLSRQSYDTGNTFINSHFDTYLPNIHVNESHPPRQEASFVFAQPDYDWESGFCYIYRKPNEHKLGPRWLFLCPIYKFLVSTRYTGSTCNYTHYKFHFLLCHTHQTIEHYILQWINILDIWRMLLLFILIVVRMHKIQYLLTPLLQRLFWTHKAIYKLVQDT